MNGWLKYVLGLVLVVAQSFVVGAGLGLALGIWGVLPGFLYGSACGFAYTIWALERWVY